MRIYLHIGPQYMGANRLHHLLDAKRAQLRGKGILFPRSPGSRNHTRLFMAVSDPDHIDPLRFNRGFIAPDKQAKMLAMLGRTLAEDIDKARPETLILAAEQLGSSLHRRSELEQLKALLTPLSEDIRIVAHVDEPGRALARIYSAQVMEGRAAPLSREVEMARAGGDWWEDSLAAAPEADPAGGQFLETQAPPFWLDYAALVRFWEDVFGVGSVTLRPHDPARLYGPEAMDELRAAFDIAPPLGQADPEAAPAPPSAATLARARSLNALLLKVLEDRKRILPRPMWRGFLDEIAVDGVPLSPGALAAISTRFAGDAAALVKAHPALSPETFRPDPTLPDWQEADPERGYRASHYLLAFLPRIDKLSKDGHEGKHADLAQVNGHAPEREKDGKKDRDGLSATARRLLPPVAVEKFHHLKTSPYAPHNRLGAVNEEDLAAAFAPARKRTLAEGSSGNVIVGCMKNEAPYIVEWIAYHRAIGIDNFLIYTNDCTDGTDEILGRLQQMGVVEHRNNDEWRGQSPQQHALNMSLKEPVVRNAEWLLHIDVDEFVNVRCGNGTLQDFFDRVPQATNVAMTWRLFGHSGVHRIEDEFVIGQFDRCAPTFCPKPHTVWGFKTMFRNIGAYQKMSCHRPNKLLEDQRDKVLWVNGSGQDITKETVDNGWRSSKGSVGYDLLQLNHYALRSADSFLIKRQRGRALHVDRSIGLNYWIRMDWDDARDVTIQRNLPRLRHEYDRLMADDRLRTLHEKGLAWHHAKAAELHAMPEFEDLYRQALEIRLTGTERAAYALALDMES